MGNLVYGFGYRSRSLVDLKERVIELDAILLDVRFHPFSKNLVWQKSNLEKVLGERYKHVRALGNVNFKGGDVLLADEEAGVQILLAELKTRSVILMCVCLNPLTCHRSIIAEALEEHGVEVEELYPEPQGELNLW